MSVFELLTQHPIVFAGVVSGGLIVGALIAELILWGFESGDPDGRIVVRRGDRKLAEISTADIAAEARRRDEPLHVTGWTDASGQRHPLDISVQGTPAELYFEAEQ